MDIITSLRERKYELRANIIYNEHVANHASSIGNDELAEKANERVEKDRKELEAIDRILDKI